VVHGPVRGCLFYNLLLCGTGFTGPALSWHGSGATGRLTSRPRDQDAFLARLLDGGAGHVSASSAGQQACRGSIEIVRLVLDGKLKGK
jgi:hypothetical protein